MPFHQLQPHMICQNRIARKSGTHRDPRCSLECRNNWARKEAVILSEQLRQVAPTHFIYFGNVQIQADLILSGHKQVRMLFLKHFRQRQKHVNFTAQFRAVSEIGRNERIHYDYVIYSSAAISQPAIKTVWDAACQPFSTIVMHGPPRKSIEAACKYVFKDLKSFRQKKKWVRLFAPHTLSITWGSAGFFSPMPKSALWRLLVVRWKQQPSHFGGPVP